MVPPLTGADSESFLVLTATDKADAESCSEGTGWPYGGGLPALTPTCFGQGDLLHVGDG